MTPKFIKTKLKGLGSLAKKGINAFGIKMRYRSTETSPTAIKDILAVLDPRFRSPVLSPNAIENILGVLDPYFRSPCSQCTEANHSSAPMANCIPSAKYQVFLRQWGYGFTICACQ